MRKVWHSLSMSNTNSKNIAQWAIITFVRGDLTVTGQVRMVFPTGGVVTDGRGVDYGFHNDEVTEVQSDEQTELRAKALQANLRRMTDASCHWQEQLENALRERNAADAAVARIQRELAAMGY